MTGAGSRGAAAVLGRVFALPQRVGRALPRPLKAALTSGICHPAVGRAIGAAFAQRIPCRGIPISTADASVTDRTRAQLFWGMYESAEIRSVRRHLDPRLDLVELGSSIGVVSCHASRRLQPDRRIVCVEANPRLIPLLSANLRANAPGRSVSVVQGAIDYTATTGEVSLEFGADSTGSRVVAGPTRAATRVRTTTLSELVRDQHLGEFALIADIEGAEAGIFLDDPGALTGCKQIIAELHATQHRGISYSPEDLAGILVARGYRILGRDGGVWSFAAPAA